jgi:hypothetical protein
MLKPLLDAQLTSRAPRSAEIGQFLHGADVASRLKQMGHKAVTQRVRRRRLVDAGGLNRALERMLEGLAVEMVSTHDAAAWIGSMMVRSIARNNSKSRRALSRQ